MKKGKSLVELATEMQRIQMNKKDIIVPTSSIIMSEAGKIEFESEDKSISEKLELTSWSAGQVASFADVPKQYFDRLREENPALLARNVNHGFSRKVKEEEVKSNLVRILDGKMRGFLSSRYRPLDGYDLLEATLPTLMGHEFEILSSEVTDKRLYLKAVTRRVEGEVKKGDVVQYGVMISTSDVGAGALKVEPFFYRCVCDNGLVMESKFRKAHLGQNNAEAQIQEFLRDETKQQNDKAFYMTVVDYLEGTMRPDNFQRELQKMRDASEMKITNPNLEKVIENAMKEVNVTGKDIKQGILHALASGNEGAGLTKWGLVNSFTKHAHSDELSYDDATELERAGGKILDLSNSAWKRIAEKP